MSDAEQLLMIGYDEIGLKGKNRGEFINRFISNISQSTGIPESNLIHRQGRIYGEYSPERKKFIFSQLAKVFGVKWYAEAMCLPLSYDELKKHTLRKSDELKEEGFQSFKVEARRSNKDFALNSHQINVQLGDEIRVKGNWEVDVHHPDVVFYVEVRREHIYLYTSPHDGPGGLPVGSNGRVLLLMSGGIDSPVAAWSLMKRGLEVDCVYFHSPPYTGEKALEKVRKLSQQLSLYNIEPVKLFVPHFTDCQEEMVEQIPEEMWTVSQRRLMHLIADRILVREEYQALATGDSVGQVASQTIENLQLIDEATNTMVLRPLTGFDKQEIINRAKRIGTFEISIEPYEDCCILFAPSHPSTRVHRTELISSEKNMDVETVINSSLEKMKVETHSRLQERVEISR